MTVIRRMRAADVPQVVDLVAETFGKPEERDAMRALLSAAYESCPCMRPEHCVVAEDAGRIVGRGQVLDLPLFVGGAVVRGGGAQGVLVVPGHRNQGLPRAIVTFGFGLARDVGFDLFLGFSQRGAFYSRIGAVNAMPDYHWRVAAAGVPAAASERFREATAEDADFMLAHYTRENAQRSGAVARSRDYWPWIPRAAPQQRVHPDGYFGFRVNSDAIELREIAGAGASFHAEALSALARLAREHGKSEICGELPPDLPVVAHARRFGGEERRSWPRHAGALARLTALGPLLDKLAPQFEARIAASPYAEERVQLAIQCDGERWETQLGHGRRERKLELPLASASLIPLLFGTRPAAVALCEAGLALDAAELALAAALFPEGYPFTWLTDRF